MPPRSRRDRKGAWRLVPWMATFIRALVEQISSQGNNVSAALQPRVLMRVRTIPARAIASGAKTAPRIEDYFVQLPESLPCQTVLTFSKLWVEARGVFAS
jgi:hypothetical protein